MGQMVASIITVPCRMGSSRTTLKSLLIAIVGGHHSGRWSCAKAHTAKSSGFTSIAYSRKIYLRSGTVRTAKDKERKPETPTQGAFSSTSKLDNTLRYLFIQSI